MLENPLAKWLDRHNLRAYTFAQQAGIAKRTAYRVAYDDNFKAKTDTLLKIEAATGGEVTMRQLVNWHNQPPLPAPAAEPIPVAADEFEDPDSTEEPD